MKCMNAGSSRKQATFIISPETIRSILRMIEASAAIYADKENQFRESIAQNLLQVFFLDTYDKVQRYFTKEQLEGGNRKGQLFKKFIHLVHTNCTTQRDVAFYAEQLCISTRYLSSIVGMRYHRCGGSGIGYDFFRSYLAFSSLTG